MAETTPKCHRVTRRAEFQQATQLLSHVCYPTETRQLTSPQGEADVWSLEGVQRRRRWGGGESTLRLIPHQKVAPLYWRSDAHTHTQTENGSKRLHIQLTWIWGGEKRSEVKSENIKYNPCKELSSQGYVEWSMIRQNPAYVDALSDPFTQ